MKNNIKKMLTELGFVEERNELFILNLPLIYSAENTKVQIFCFEKEESVYLSDGGKLLPSYDVPSIDFEGELKNIQKLFFDKTDLLKNCHILKRLNGDEYLLGKELSEFIKLVIKIEDYFEKL